MTRPLLPAPALLGRVLALSVLTLPLLAQLPGAAFACDGYEPAAVPAASAASGATAPAAGRLALPDYRESHAAIAAAWESGRQPSHRRLWVASLAALATASALDAASSWNRRELNPLLQDGDGRFGPRGAAVKFGLAGGIGLFQALMGRSRPGYYRAMAITNFGIAGGYGAVATANYRSR
jgi:hypothetical protein